MKAWDFWIGGEPVLDRYLELLSSIALLLLLLPLIVYAAPFVVGGDDARVVLSGSMEPTLSVGDIVITEGVEPGRIGEGDVITFRRNGDYVTHRVVEVENSSAQEFVTKGDANEDRDRKRVTSGSLKGRMLFSIPLYGFVLRYAGQGVLPLVLVLGPGVILIAMEVRRLLSAKGDDP